VTVDAAAAAAALSRRKARKYVVTEKCRPNCTLGERLLPGDAFHRMHALFEAGSTYKQIQAGAAELGLKISTGAIARHSKHLVPEDQMHTLEELEETGGEGPALSDIDILERLIQAGSKNLADKKVRVSPEMLMKAMELKYKLTQGNVFQGFMDAVNAAMDPPAPAGETLGAEAAATVRSEDEQAQASPE
jgi:hypothetical protein